MKSLEKYKSKIHQILENNSKLKDNEKSNLSCVIQLVLPSAVLSLKAANFLILTHPGRGIKFFSSQNCGASSSMSIASCPKSICTNQQQSGYQNKATLITETYGDALNILINSFNFTRQEKTSYMSNISGQWHGFKIAL